MFKKIEIWILYLTIVLGIFFTIGFGLLVRQELVGDTKAGSISKAALFLAEIPINLKNMVTAKAGLADEQRFPDKNGFSGRPLDQQAYLLLSRYDGDRTESVVELIDLTNFEVLHSWNPNIAEINSLVDTSNPEFRYLDRDSNEKRYAIYHPLPDSDGSLVFHSNGSPLVKIDYCSDLVWQNQDDKYHHSIEFDAEGNVWVPTHMYPYAIDQEFVGSDVDNYYDDAITKVSPAGKVLFQKSLSEILIRNNMKHLLFHSFPFHHDPIHLNDIQPVLKDGAYWKTGDVFLSLRNLSMIILYRPSTDKIIWISQWDTLNQHDVNILNDHQISVFDNKVMGYFNNKAVDGHNEVAVYDFSTNQYTKYLNESLLDHDVRTPFEGRSRILANGDLLVEETNFGRTLYFDSNGSLRWEHVNRASNGALYVVVWSRILYLPKDISMIQSILETKNCNDE